MRIFGMGLPELIIILAVILLIFGPKTLPKLGSAFGKTVKNLREGMGSKKEPEEAIDEMELEPAVEGVTVTEAVEQEPQKTVKRVVRKKSE